MDITAAHVLLVDDELPIRITLGDLLKRKGFNVVTASNGQEALDILYQRPFDVMVFDLKMPGMSGIELAQRAHQRQPDAAILILTGHGSLESAIEGIHLGIFDYLLKTTPPREVVERVVAAFEQKESSQRRDRALAALRDAMAELESTPQANTPAPSSEGWLTVGNLRISTWKQTVHRDDQLLALTPTEFRVLACLAQQAGQVMSAQDIIRCAQSYDTNAMEAAELIKPHVYHLRQKIEPDPSAPRYILTVRGAGYMLADPDNS